MDIKESEKLIKLVAEKHNGICLLAFSRGKDSILSWMQLKKHFKTIVPYYLKMIPEELSFETESLSYYEDIFQTKIIRLISPSFYRMLNDQVLQSPERLPIIDDHNIKGCSYMTIQRFVKQNSNLPDTIYSAVGVTQYDSFLRRMAVKKTGGINTTKKEFYPIFDFTRTEIFNIIEKANIKLPKDYKAWGKTYDGLDYRFSKPLKEYFPEDYEKMKFWFPLLETEIIRYEQV